MERCTPAGIMFHAWLLVFSLEERIQPDPCGETAVILSVPAVIILTFPALLIPAPEFPASFQILGSETFNLRSLVDVPRSSCQKDKNKHSPATVRGKNGFSETTCQWERH